MVQCEMKTAQCHTLGAWGSPLWGCRGTMGLLFLVGGGSGHGSGLLTCRGFSEPPGGQCRAAVEELCGQPEGVEECLSLSRPCLPSAVSVSQDYELEAEKLRSLLDLENGRSSHVSKKARLQSPATKVREEVSSGPGLLRVPTL